MSMYLAGIIIILLKNKKLSFALIALVIILSVFMPQSVKDRFGGAADFSEGTTSQRIKLWSGCLEMIKVHPVLGFGVNTYTKNFPDFKPKNCLDSIYTHNCYMQMASEIGIVGLTLFLIFITLCLFYIGSSVKMLPLGWIRSMAIGIFAGIAGFLLHSAVDTHLYSTTMAVMFYFLLGLCIALCNYARNSRP